jgi:hypothetical protein
MLFYIYSYLKFYSNFDGYRYGVDSTLNLQATVDALRQELHREKNNRAAERAALIIDNEESCARAIYSETVLKDVQVGYTYVYIAFSLLSSSLPN